MKIQSCLAVFLFLVGPVFGQVLVTRGLPPAPPSSYEGIVASRGIQPNTSDTTNRSFNSRVVMFWRDIPTSVSVILGNFYVRGTGVEQGNGGSFTCTGSIEYPAGTFNQLLWSASPSVTVNDLSTAKSDYITPSKAPVLGDAFYVRTYCTTVVGFTVQNRFCNNSGINYGEAFNSSTGALSDLTLGGTITNNQNVRYYPIMVVGQTTKPSIVIWGDSIGAGNLSFQDSVCDVGSVALNLGSLFAYTNFSQDGNCMGGSNGVINGPTIRKTLIHYASDQIVMLGLNDIFHCSRTAAQALADAQTMAGWATSLGLKAWSSTISPKSSSTDGWITLVNQTTGTFNPARVAFNDTLRAGLAGLTGYFETADQVESSRNSGIFGCYGDLTCGGGAGGIALTTDGEHLGGNSGKGYLQLTAGYPPSMIHRP